MLRLSFYAVRSKQSATMSTSVGRDPSTGQVHVKRTEFGVGKGRWKRRLRAFDSRVKINTLWFGLWSRYTLDHEGTATNVDTLWEMI